MKRLVDCFVIALFAAVLSASPPAHAETTCYQSTINEETTCYEDSSVDWLGVVVVGMVVISVTLVIVILADDNENFLALQETESFLQNNLETSYDSETNRVRVGFTANF
ncbi:MAG: hypothetical protein OXE98_07695 [Hyphomicrobiales bacterium]|nr:hypothetical protein [Hyphomicrobiales bacterium]